MGSILFAILTFLLTIFIVAGIHEWGHFCLARFFGIKVLKFSIGFGKVLWRVVDKQGTEYCLSMVPFGGYVKLLDSREGAVKSGELTHAFDHRPIYQRFCVLMAGSAFNFLLAILALWLVHIQGIIYVKPVIGAITPNSIAARAGLQPQEEILAVGKRATLSWSAVTMALVHHYGENKALSLTVRNTVSQQRIKHTLYITSSNWHLNDLRPDLISSLGVEPYLPKNLIKDKKGKINWPSDMLQKTHYNVFSACIKAVNDTGYFISFTGIVLYKMVTGVISWRGLSGPIGIFQAAAGAAQQGIIIYFYFIAFISTSIGLLNILPIPGLDGAQIVYLLYESICGKPVTVAAQVLAFRLGAILLIIIMLQAFLNDLLRLR